MAETAIPKWKQKPWFLKYTPEITQDKFEHIIRVLEESNVFPRNGTVDVLFSKFQKEGYLRAWATDTKKYRIAETTEFYKELSETIFPNV